jgi:hypothetical protein
LPVAAAQKVAVAPAKREKTSGGWCADAVTAGAAGGPAEYVPTRTLPSVSTAVQKVLDGHEMPVMVG